MQQQHSDVYIYIYMQCKVLPLLAEVVHGVNNNINVHMSSMLIVLAAVFSICSGLRHVPCFTAVVLACVASLMSLPASSLSSTVEHVKESNWNTSTTCSYKYVSVLFTIKNIPVAAENVHLVSELSELRTSWSLHGNVWLEHDLNRVHIRNLPRV